MSPLDHRRSKSNAGNALARSRSRQQVLGSWVTRLQYGALMCRKRIILHFSKSAKQNEPATDGFAGIAYVRRLAPSLPYQGMCCPEWSTKCARPLAGKSINTVISLLTASSGAMVWPAETKGDDKRDSTVPGCKAANTASGRLRDSSMAAVCYSMLRAALAAR